MEERYKWEEIIRSKLKDFEVDTHPDDWKAIEGRLSGNKVVFFRRWYYVAAAITLFLLITGGYFYFSNVGDMPIIAETGETGEAVTSYEIVEIAEIGEMKKKTSRRWSFGAGGGSYSVGTTGGGFANMVRSDDAMYTMSALNNGAWYMETPVRRNDDLNEFLANTSNLAINETNIQKVDVSHKQPISLGIGVGYTLNNRWSLQSGLVYTLLSSEWKTVYDQEKYKQQLHFVGVPFGINYKIAEWNKLRFYATAGGMAEWSVSGNSKTKSFFPEDEDYGTVKKNIRMKEMQWSVNARVGATYPLIRFVNVYIEGGANYYFNNYSSIETIRSDKPFHISLQAGVHFGF